MNYYILFEQCIRILKEIKQNFQIEPYNSFNYIEQYPNVKICKQRYEEYGRILFNYHHNNDKLPYIIRNILYILNEDNLEKSMVERKKWLLNEIYKFVDLLTSLSNDPKWLEMLYGQKIDMKKALTIHNQFCKEYNIIETLKALRASTKIIEKDKFPGDYYLINIDFVEKRVNLRIFSKSRFEKASEEYVQIEKEIDENKNAVVLVASDSIKSIKRAYPSYFLDTSKFIYALEKINKDCIERGYVKND